MICYGFETINGQKTARGSRFNLRYPGRILFGHNVDIEKIINLIIFKDCLLKAMIKAGEEIKRSKKNINNELIKTQGL